MMNLTTAIEKYTSVFRLYAWYYHIREKRRHRSQIGICEKEADNPLQIRENLKDWVCSLEEEAYIIYGKNILDEYGKTRDTVLFVSHELSLSGAPIALLNYSVMMQKKGWQSVLISPEDGPLGQYAVEHNIPVIVIPQIFKTDYILEIRELFKQIVVNTAVGMHVIQLLSGTKTPVVWWVHECAQFYSRNTAEQMPWTVGNNIRIFCAGPYARKMLKKRFPCYRVEQLIYCADDLKKRSRGKRRKKDSGRSRKGQVYACIAMLEKRKGQDILIEAISLLPEELRKNCRFLFVGKDADADIKRSIFEKMAEYPEQIKYYGVLGREELYDLYEEIDYLICPSRDDPMPVVVAEALSLGKPCICSKNTGSAAVIGGFHAGFCYGHDDPRRLAELIVKTNRISDDCYDKLSINARAAYESTFSEKVFEENVMKICL